MAAVILSIFNCLISETTPCYYCHFCLAWTPGSPCLHSCPFLAVPPCGLRWQVVIVIVVVIIIPGRLRGAQREGAALTQTTCFYLAKSADSRGSRASFYIHKILLSSALEEVKAIKNP